MQIGEVERCILALDDADEIVPLTRGDLFAYFVPFELVKDDIFRRGEIERANALSNDFFTRAQALLLGVLASFGQEDIDLEHRIKVNDVERGTVANGISNHIRINVVLGLKTPDERVHMFEMYISHDIDILRRTRNAVS